MGPGARLLSARTPWDTGQTGPRARAPADRDRPQGSGAAQAGRRIFDAERAQVLAVEGGERFRAPVYRFVSTVTMAVEKFPPSSNSNSSSVCSRSIGFSPPELPRLYS